MQIHRRHHKLSWPRPEDSGRIACHSCDALQQAPRLLEGQAARCGCCGSVLFQNRPHSLARVTAWSSAALVLMLVVHSFPFLTMRASGVRTELTLIESVASLADKGQAPLAVAVFFCTIVAPLVIAFSLLYVAAPLRHGRTLPGSVTLTRWIQFCLPWSMLEVFLLGLLVSLLKLGHVAEIHLGTGLWALAGLTFCLAAALSSINRHELWDRLQIARHQRP